MADEKPPTLAGAFDQESKKSLLRRASDFLRTQFLPKQENKDEHPIQDKLLSWIEIITIFLIVFFIFVSSIYFATWVFTGKAWSICERLKFVLRGVNNNWRADLILAIPLFYRPLRRFFLKVVKAGPLEAEKQSAKEEKLGTEYKKNDQL